MVHSPKMALFSAFCVAVALTTLFSQVFRLSNPSISSHAGQERIAGFTWENVGLHSLQLGSVILLFCPNLQLAPSRSLEWQSCAPGRECARLIVRTNHKR